MSELDLVVFDMAGTTIQASDQVPAAFRGAFAHSGIALSDEDVQSVRGKSKREAVAELMRRYAGDADEPADETETFRKFRCMLLQGYQEQGVAPVDGAEDTFAWLRERDVKIALGTGFDQELADLLIRLAGWERLVDVVVCNDDVPRGRPAPYLLFKAMEHSGCGSVHRVAAVGDTIADLQAAHNAGIRRSIGVLSGAHSRSQLESCPHSEIIESVRNLPAVLEKRRWC